MKARCAVFAMVLAATAVAGAKEPLSIRVSPAFSFAPANVVIAPKTMMVEFRSLPPGNYEVTASLIGVDGTLGRLHRCRSTWSGLAWRDDRADSLSRA